MKATRINKVDSSKANPSDARAYGGPHTAGVDFDEYIDALVIFPDSPNTSGERKIALGGYYSNGTAATLASTIDFNNGQVQAITLADGTNVLTFSNGVAGQRYTLRVTQGNGSDLVTWPSAVKWPAGSAPTLTTTASRTDVFTFVFDGTNYIGSTVGLNYTLA